MNVVALQSGHQVDAAPNLSSTLSVVSADLLSAGARKRLIMRVEPGSTLARPKLVGFKSDDNDRNSRADDIQWAVYINKHVCFVNLCFLYALYMLMPFNLADNV